MELTAEQAQQYLAQNPNARVVSNQTGQVYTNQPQPAQRGLWGSIWEGLTGGFRRGAQQASDIGGWLTISALAGLQDKNKVLQIQPDWTSYAGEGGASQMLGTPDLLTEAERQRWSTSPIIEGVKSGAQMGSVLMPGVGTGFKGALATGAISGGLGGFGMSESTNPVEALGEGAKSAATGTVFAGGLYGLGKGLEKLGGIKNVNVADKLDNMADDLRTTSFKKAIGTAPSMGQGKYDLVRDVIGLSDELGVKIKSADDLYQFGDDILKNYGGLADDFAQQFDNTGNVINVAELKKPLVDKLNSVKSAELKAPLQRVLDSIDNATGGRGQISATELLQLRREWGDLGNWNKFTPASEQSIAKAFEEAYTSANNVLDTNLSKVGYKDFRNVNKALKTAIESKNWARRASATTSSAPVWTDMTQDAVMFGGAVAGGPGALASFAVTKGLQRYGEDITQKGIGGVADILRGGGGKVPQAVSGVGTLLQRGATTPAVTSGITSVLGGVGQAQIPQNQTEAQQMGVYGGMGEGVPSYDQLNAQITLNLLNSGYSVSEASQLAQLLLASNGITPAVATGTSGLPTTAQGQLASADTALSQLDSIEQTLSSGKYGVTGGIEQILPLGLGAETKSINAQLDAAAQTIGRFLEGGKLTEEDIKRYRENILPKITDSRQVAQAKIENLRALLQQTKSDVLANYSQ